MPAAGTYNRRVEIQVNTPTLDSSRRKVDHWSMFCVRYARQKTPRPAMVLLPDAGRSEITAVTFIMRPDSKTRRITSNYQLIANDQTFRIEAATVNDDGDIELSCKAREFEK